MRSVPLGRPPARPESWDDGCEGAPPGERILSRLLSGTEQRELRVNMDLTDPVHMTSALTASVTVPMLWFRGWLWMGVGMWMWVGVWMGVVRMGVGVWVLREGSRLRVFLFPVRESEFEEDWVGGECVDGSEGSQTRDRSHDEPRVDLQPVPPTLPAL